MYDFTTSLLSGLLLIQAKDALMAASISLLDINEPPFQNSVTTFLKSNKFCYKGILPCFLAGRFSRLPLSISRALASLGLVSDGSITSST